ncbi:hypothetical protein I3U44_09130 [Mycobacteroides abscessus subsp. bolletii]|nr:hypothetical protein I3U44_07485 [Mycobacteroides abscessus subsp. bolletii]QSM91658.1 hypothetical protein I3U44_09130 [Mycobacteroides abscessus subsp. bolletii]
MLDLYDGLTDLPLDSDDLIAAAREALRPIRDIHQKWAEAYAYRADGLVLNAFLAALAPLIFTTEELER